MIILLAPEPFAAYEMADGTLYKSDHRQVILNVAEQHVDALTSGYDCTVMPPVIVAISLPSPVSVHCFACGEFIEPRPVDDPWYWLAGGHIPDFLHYHRPHATDMITKPPARVVGDILPTFGTTDAELERVGADPRRAAGYAVVSGGIAEAAD